MGAVVLSAQIFDLLVDGLDVLVDLALVAQALGDGLGQQLVGRIVPLVYLPQGVHLARQRIDVAQAHLRGQLLRGRQTAISLAMMVAAMVVVVIEGRLQQRRPVFVRRGQRGQL